MKKKWSFACLALCLTLILAAALGANAATVLLGDVTGDGVVTSADARLILRRAAKLEELSDNPCADLNRDGVVNASDARIALRLAAKLEEPRFLEEQTTDPGTMPLEPNMRLMTDEACPYCGKSDCPAMAYDVKLGAAVFKPENAARCPAYTPATTAEPTTEAPPIPEPCEICGLAVGHLRECANYTPESDPACYCQTCHLPVGFGKDKCITFNVDMPCPNCGIPVKSWDCHHCAE